MENISDSVGDISYSDLIPASDNIYIVLQVVILLAMGVGIPGNIITIFVVVRSRRLHTPENALLVNLSIADLLYYVLILPIRYATFYHREWGLTETFCRLLGASAHFLVGTSLFTMGAIALSRFLHVIFTNVFRKFYSRKCITIQIICLWTLTFALCILLPVTKAWGEYSFNEDVLSCTLHPSQDTSYKTFLLVFGFSLPFGSITFCYISIFIYVRASQKKVEKWSFRNVASRIRSNSVRNKVNPGVDTESAYVRYKKNNSPDNINLDSVTSTSSDDKNNLLSRKNKMKTEQIGNQVHDLPGDFCLQLHRQEINRSDTEEQQKKDKQRNQEKKKLSTVSTTCIHLEGFYTHKSPEHQNTFGDIVTDSERMQDIPTVGRSVKSQLCEHSYDKSNVIQSGDRDSDTHKNGHGSVRYGKRGSVRFSIPGEEMCPVETVDTPNLVKSDNYNDTRISRKANTIINKTRDHEQNIQDTSDSKDQTRTNDGLTLLCEKHQKEGFRLTLMMSTTFFVFFVCSFPYTITNLALHENNHFPTIYLVTLMTTFLNGCLNPFIYALMSSQFRVSYTEILCVRPCECYLR